MSCVDTLRNAAAALTGSRPQLAAAVAKIADRIASIPEPASLSVSYPRTTADDIALVAQAAELLTACPDEDVAQDTAGRLILAGVRFTVLGEAVEKLAAQRVELLGHLTVLRA
ncbi:hypothetical protein RKE25_23310 (plasmid) [Dyella sp. BiH032]|uniref:hypothetical protein n=1 Tax=Dyella sp. BiH032 TaxID=3075430 RepID=UPI0028937E98|nr:hypothetical protein [Dyella sp. BiH032]WNL48545.1 hypothetical protein RKE25_23310 [Dyella sp. BiH032]